jgi:hypothetical protein
MDVGGAIHKLPARKGDGEKLDVYLICCQLIFTHFEDFGLKDIFLVLMKISNF